VALGRVVTGVGAELLAREPLRSDHRHEDDLMPAIDRLFRAAGASPKDIRRVAVSAGPGGFTGLRSAIAATGLPWRVRDAGTQIEMLLVPPGTFLGLAERYDLVQRLDRWVLTIRDDKVVLGGAVLAGLGAVVLGGVAFDFLRGGFGPGGRIREMVLGTSLLVGGIQVIFASFVVSLIDDELTPRSGV
jgi:hypothetical protein